MTPTRRTVLVAMSALAAMPVLGFAASGGSGSRLVNTPLRIGVIGAGWLGGTVGRCWVKAGHEVLFSTRHPEELESWVKPLGPRASFGTPQQAAGFGDIAGGCAAGARRRLRAGRGRHTGPGGQFRARRTGIPGQYF